jgi:hypothetical protein
MRAAKMSRSRLTTLGLFLTLTVGACSVDLPEPWDVAAARDRDAARAEAILDVYRQGSAVYGAGLDMCVSLDRDADVTRVLRQLDGRGPRVWQSQRCAVQGLSLVEPISGRQAIEAIVSEVEMVYPGRARVQAGFLRGPLAGEGRELIVEFMLGRWRVTSSKNTWIS